MWCCLFGSDAKRGGSVVVAIAKASLADVKLGAFVGVTGMPQRDGTQRALEVQLRGS
jgi:hypothetical protein